MTLALIALAGGLLVGYARGGRLANIPALPLRRRRLLVHAFVARVLGVLCAPLWPPAFPVLTAVAAAFLGLFTWVNRRVHGVALIGLGLALDWAGRLDLLPWLGDVVPVAFPPRPEMVSPGEVVLAAGLGLLLATGLSAVRPEDRSVRPEDRLAVPRDAARPVDDQGGRTAGNRHQPVTAGP